jgi:hypothetical protein
MSAESTARELIDAFNAGEDEAVHLPTDWTVLIVHDALDDLVSAGLRSDVARRVIEGDGHPLEKWLLVEDYVDRARTTGYLRAVDLTTERLFGLPLDRSTCEEIDAACRRLRQLGYYRHVLGEVAGVDGVR